MRAGEQRHEYRWYEMDEAHFIQRSDIPVYFALSSLDYDRLNDVNAASLYPAADAEEEADQDTPGEQAPH